MTTERFATEPTAGHSAGHSAEHSAAGRYLEHSIEAATPATEVAARFFLDQVMARVGVDGLVAALSEPALIAVVDQHAAAVRESLSAAGKDVDPVSLAGYARSILAAAQRHGRELPDGRTLDWSGAEWFVLRLVGVCSLADQADCF